MSGRSAKEGWDERNLETLIGLCQRSGGEREVGLERQLKRCWVVSSCWVQRGQEGEGVLSGSILCW